MAAQLKLMRVDELVRKLWGGERDFSGIQLPDGSDLAGHKDFGGLVAYLRSQNLKVSPVNITGSQLSGVKAGRLYLPYVIGAGAYLGGADLGEAILFEADLGEAILLKANLGGANLGGAYLRGANLGGANLGEAILRKANLGGANLLGADLREADLREADLKEADLSGAYLGGAYLAGANLGGANLGGANLGGAYLRGAYLGEADFREADLRGVRTLSKALNLRTANFFETIVGPKEKLVIERELRTVERFVVR